MKKIVKLVCVSALMMASLSSYALETTVASGVMSSYSQLVASLATSSDVQVVEFNALQDDAINFLANGELSEALSSFINEFKMKNPNFSGLNDRDVALALTELN